MASSTGLLKDALTIKVRGYAIAAAAVALAWMLTLLIHRLTGTNYPMLLMLAAVLASGTVGGAGPAAMAAMVGAVIVAITLPNIGLSGYALFLAVAAGVVAVSPRLTGMVGRRFSGHARQPSEELSLLIDGAVDYAIYMLDPDGCITIWNKGAERLKGWSEEEVVGQSSAIFYPADAVAEGRPQMDLAEARQAGRMEDEAWQVRKDGSEFLAHISVTALYDDRGALRGFSKVVRDVTDQRAIERKLTVNAAHLQSILSTIPDAMVVIDEQGMILSFSAAAQRLFGYSEREVVGRNVSLLMPSPDRERHDGYLEHYRRTGERRMIGVGRTVVAQRRDGSSFPIALSVGEAISGEQRIFTGFVRDLSDQRDTQERMEELRANLVHVARVSAMGTMASTLAHELNQPITAVTNYVETVRDVLGTAEPSDIPMLREALDDAANEALRAGHIVRRLRDFVARGEVEKTVEDLPSVIDEAGKLGLIGAREKGVRVVMDIDATATPVLVDRVQIQQVLINLMRNAVEAMSMVDDRELTVSTRRENEDHIRVTVADTGPGVASEVQEDLFRAFNSTKRDGMGLGLSICRTIVEANGGRIWLESRSGGGASFNFTLVKAEAGEANERATADTYR